MIHVVTTFKSLETIPNWLHTSDLYEDYQTQKRNAWRRHIPWLFTYHLWLDVWMKSGHLDQRSNRQGGYVMSRPGDIGPYAPWNVRIILHVDNLREGARIRKGRINKEITK